MNKKYLYKGYQLIFYKYYIRYLIKWDFLIEMSQDNSTLENNMTQDSIGKNRSKGEITSFSLARFNHLMTISFINLYLLFFWEVEVKLPISYIGIVLTIYAIWNAVNDPIVGYLSDKTRWYTRRWGRRFPLIILGSLPLGVFMLLLFVPPSIDPIANPIPLFLWFLIIYLIMEFFGALTYINITALFPQKFRTNKDRRLVSGLEVVIRSVIRIFAQVVPALFIIRGNISSYRTAAIVVVLLGLPGFLFSIKGIREDKELIDQAFLAEGEDSQYHNFIPTFRMLVKKRNFAAITFPAILNNCAATLFETSIIYLLIFVYNLTIAEITPILLTAALIVFPLLPIGLYINKKVGFVRGWELGLFIGGFSFVIILIALLFTHSIFIVYVVVPLMVLGGVIGDTSDAPLHGWFLDDLAVQEKRRIEGAFVGIRYFLLYIAVGPINALILTLTHEMTGFDPYADVQTPLAQLGILLHGAIFPMIFYWLGALFFAISWTITPEEAKENKRRLEELKL